MARTKNSIPDAQPTRIRNRRPDVESVITPNKRSRPPLNAYTGRTYQQLLFIHEYCKDMNATKAAIRAGYSTDTAASIGSQLLRKLKHKVDAALQEKLYRVDFDAESMVNELAKIATVNVQDLFDENDELIPIADLPRHVAAAISSFEVVTETTGKGEDRQEFLVRKIRLWDKRASIETLMKYLGILIDKKELTGKDGKDLIPSTVTHTFDIKQLNEKQLDALITLSGNQDPIELIPLSLTDKE